MAKISIRNDAPDLIANRKTFWTTTLAATMLDENDFPFMAKLPQEWRDKLRETQDAGGPVYVVSSYCTPIAWVASDGVVTIPDVKYSVTTSKHQAIARRALAQ